MKLTKTQQIIYNELVEEVNKAKDSKNFDEYWDMYYSDRFQAQWKPTFENTYLQACNGIVSVYKAKHESLRKLEFLGLIKIINIETNLIQLV